MGKRKGGTSEVTETLIDCNRHEDEEGKEELEEGEKSGFFACYLLTSLCPRYKGHTYIGFTVTPRRRIRQHNGELCSGAWRTKKKRPWEMVLCIFGFPTNVAALQFEWAWQHPIESLAVRKAAVGFKSLGGLANKIKLAYTMLTLPAWHDMNLTVNFFSTSYTKHYAGCPSLPNHMKVHVRSMDELPCYTEGYIEADGDMFNFENDLSDGDERDRTGASYESETPRLQDTTMPVLDSADDQKNEQPSCTSNSPDEPSTDCCSVVSPVNEDQNGTDCFRVSVSSMALDIDEPGTKISAFRGQAEVIDLLTPSPEHRASSRRKKRGVSAVHPEIIDLTQSPIFV